MTGHRTQNEHYKVNGNKLVGDISVILFNCYVQFGTDNTQNWVDLKEARWYFNRISKFSTVKHKRNGLSQRIHYLCDITHRCATCHIFHESSQCVTDRG